MCLLFFTIFKRKMYFSVIPNEVHWKEFWLTFVFSSHRFMNIHSCLSYHALPTFLKLVLKKNCMCNWDNAHDVDVFQMTKITKRSELINQAQAKIISVKGLQTYLNDLKNYLTTYEGFKVRLVILKILGKYWHIWNKWRIVWRYFFALTLKVKV